jgi:hypothetical protein
MADTTTNLKIKADDREIKKLRQSVKTAFDSRTLREFRGETRDLERQVVSLSRKQADLTKQLEKVDKGTKKFKELKDELKGVADHTKLVVSSMQQLDRVQQRAMRQTEVSGRRRFAQGLAQGAGIAQYIPTAPGMGAQIGGAMLAGGIRRGAGMAAAPFTMPGLGGLAAGLQGVPIVGGMAAGALQQASAAYQATVQFDRARLQNMYFAGPQRESSRQAAAASAARARSAGVGVRSSLQTMVTGEGPAAAAAASAVPQAYAAGEGRGDYVDPLDPMAALKAQSPKSSEALDRSVAAAARMPSLVNRANRADAAARASRNRIRSGLGGPGVGIGLGFGPMQQAAMKGEMFRARGGRFDDAGQEQFNQAMAAQIRFGTSMGQAGQFGRMGLAGGGGTGMQGLATVLQGAVAVGLKGSQVPEFLQTLVSLGQSAEKQGIKLNVTEFGKMTMQLRQGGLKGLQGQRVAGGFVQAAQGLASRGVQSPLDVLMLRGAGFQPGQGLEGYAAAMQRLEEPDAELMSNVMGMITQGTGGFGTGGRRLLAKRALGRMGIQVGLRQAGALTEAFGRGEVPDISGLLAAQRQQGGAAGLMERARGLVPGTAVEAAGLEQRRIAAGRKADWVVGFEKAAIDSAASLNNFKDSLSAVSGAVGGFVNKMDELTKGGLDGIIKRINQTLSPHATPIGEQ